MNSALRLSLFEFLAWLKISRVPRESDDSGLEYIVSIYTLILLRVPIGSSDIQLTSGCSVRFTSLEDPKYLSIVIARKFIVTCVSYQELS
jgi:hypothetical protein